MGIQTNHFLVLEPHDIQCLVRNSPQHATETGHLHQVFGMRRIDFGKVTAPLLCHFAGNHYKFRELFLRLELLKVLYGDMFAKYLNVQVKVDFLWVFRTNALLEFVLSSVLSQDG